jgi:hypothetical protein
MLNGHRSSSTGKKSPMPYFAGAAPLAPPAVGGGMGLPSGVIFGGGVVVGTVVVTPPSPPQPTIPQNKATIVRVDATCLAIRIVMRVRP